MSQTVQAFVFVDANVSDIQHLISGVQPGYHIHVLGSDQDGVAQINAVLHAAPAAVQREIHIISHGAPGSLALGNTYLSLSTLDQYASVLKTWFPSSTSLLPHHFSALYLYGCHVAAGDAGEEFMAKLRKLTGAAIAASTSPVGNAAKGGSWHLDTVVGGAKQPAAIATSAQQTYAGVFADVVTDVSTPGSIPDNDTVNGLEIDFDLTGQPAGFTVEDITLGLNLDHANRGQIRVELQAPDGTTVTLIDSISDGNDNFDILLGDAFAGPIDDNTNDVTGAPLYDRQAKPDNPFSAFQGKTVQGTWKLRIFDTSFGIAGTFNQARLTITPADTSNELPVFNAVPDPVSFSENTTDPVITVTVTDADSDPISFLTLTGEDANRFILTDNQDGTATLTPGSSFDLEGGSSDDGDDVYQVTITATDSKANVAQDVNISIVNANDQPSGSITVTSDGSPGFQSGDTLTAMPSIADQDGTTTASFNYEWEASADGVSGWTSLNAPDQNTYVLSAADVGKFVRAVVSYTDDGGFADNELSSAATEQITGVPNDPPVFNAVTPEDFVENTTGTAVTASASDSDTPITYSLDSAIADNALFNIDGSTGAVTFLASPDFEAPQDANQDNGYEIQVKATDDLGASSVQDITINVVDGNDIPANQSSVLNSTVPSLEDHDYIFSAQNGNALTIDDADANDSFRVVLSVPSDQGVITLGNSEGISVINDGTNVVTILNATQSQVAAALEGTKYTPPANFVGSVTMTVSVADSAQLSDEDTITFDIQNVNDPAVITGDFSGSVVEDSQESATGTLSASDIDDGESGAFTPITNEAGNHGTFSITSNGQWQYTYNDELPGGASATDSFTVTTDDGTTATIDISVAGANDIPVITGDTDVSGIKENDTSFATGELTVTDADGEAESAFMTQSNEPGTYGFFSLSANGKWTYILDNSRSATAAIAEGAIKQDVFEIKTADGTAQSFTVNIEGTDDAPTITGDFSGAVKEDTVLSATGTLIVEDVDENESFFQPITSSDGAATGTYGTFTIDANGGWSYVLDSSPAVNALPEGTTKTDSFTVTTTDGTTRTVLVSVEGTNDGATISLQNGDSQAQTITEDDTAPVTGTLSVSDADTDEAVFQVVEDAAGSYGTFSMESSGNWSYQLDQAVDSLPAGASETEVFTIDSKDGTATETITITIDGVNDDATISSDGPGESKIGEVTEDVSLTATGRLSITDLDAGEAGFVALTDESSDSGYGTVSADAAGNWTYALDNQQAAVQNLGASDTLTDSFVMTSLDGTQSETITITVRGVNDAPVVSEAIAASFTEDEAGPFTVDLLAGASDIDSKGISVTNLTPSETVPGIEVSGSDLKVSPTAYDALAEGETKVVSYAYDIVDGDGGSTPQTATITFKGVNDAPVAGPLIDKTVTESDDAFTVDLTSVVTDSDTNDTLVANSINLTSGDAKGVSVSGSSLQVNPNAYDDLGAGDSEVIVYTYRVTDGIEVVKDLTATVTVSGENDVPVISGNTSGSVTEDVVDKNDDLTVSGSLTISDPDAGESEFQTTVAGGTYGSLTIDASGNWNYAVANSNSDISALGAEDTLTDTFTVTSKDGTETQDIVITIQGASDSASVSGVSTGTITEDAFPSTLLVNGQLTVNDTDTGEAEFKPDTHVGNYGTLTIAKDGLWEYSADNTQTAIQSLPGARGGDPAGELVETITVETVDGTTADIQVTITGVDDASNVSGTNSGDVTEDQSVDQGNLITTGQLTITDVDSGEDVFIAGSATKVGSAIGNLTIEANGAWTYTVDNAATEIQNLTVGETLDEVFTVKSFDGTETNVTITINGTDDAATIDGDTVGFVIEDEQTPATGNLTITDPDSAGQEFQVINSGDSAGQGTYGNFEIDASGSWTYTLDDAKAATDALTEDDTVSDIFEVSALDGTSETVKISVFGANDAPAPNDSFTPLLNISAVEDKELKNIPRRLFTEGFTDPEGDPISVVPVGGNPFIDSAAGTLVDNGNGTFTFTPTQDFSGDVTVTYAVTDGENSSAPITGTFTVAPANDAPVTKDGPTDTVPNTDEDTASTFDITKLTNGFTDVDGDSLSVTNLNLSSGSGSIVDNGNGTITFTPAQDFNGPVTLTYTVTDGQGGNVTGVTQDFEVSAVNDNPTGSPDPTLIGDAAEDAPFTIDLSALTAGFTDVDGDTLKITSLFADIGTVSDVGDGLGPFTYTPIENYVGPVELTYSITDGNGGKVNNQRLTFDVIAANDAPEGLPTGTIADGLEDTPHTIDNSVLVEGFEDTDGDALFAIAVQPSVSGDAPTGTIKNNENGTFTYTPAENFNGEVTLTYRVTDNNGGNTEEVTRSFTIQPQNDAPVGGPLTAEITGTDEDVPLDIVASDLLNGFSDIDGDELTVENLTVSSGSGAITLQEGGYRFTPADGFTGTVTLTYDVSDGEAEIAGVTRTFEVGLVNDAPTGTVSISGSPEEDTTLTVNTSGLEDADGLSNAVYTYQWQRASAVGDAPGDDWQNIEGAVGETFTPGDAEVGFFLRAIVSYQDDAGFSETVESEPTVQAISNVNDAPTGSPTGTLPAGTEDTPVTLLSANLLEGFVDVDGNETLSVTDLTATNGAISADGDNFVFTPDADYAGPVTLTYAVQDDAGEKLENQSLTFNIDNVNDAPTVSAPIEGVVTEDDALFALDLLQNAADIDDEVLSVNLTLPEDSVGVTLNGTNLDIDPGAYDSLAEGDSKILTFNYSIADAAGDSVPQTATVTINGLNDAPEGEATGVISTSLQDSARTISSTTLIGGFFDIDEGDFLSIENVTADTGAIATGENGNFVFTPEAGYVGTVELNYEVTDGVSSLAAKQSFEVKSDQIPPVVFNMQQYVRFNLLDEGVAYAGPALDLSVGGIALSAIFDETYYLSQYPSVSAAVNSGAFSSGFEHFVNFGLAEGRNPSYYYDEAFYLDQNADIAAAVEDGSFESGLLHYLQFGHKEFRAASKVFDFNDYVNNHSDISDAIKAGQIGSGFEHYVENGAAEGRMPGLLYEEAFYLSQNPDVAEAVNIGAFQSGYEHYVFSGQKEGRNPGPLFNEAAYLGSNPDIANAVAEGAFSSGMEHFIRFGRAEGRPQFTPENLDDF
ncbi:VCBS domain-containing protein [Oscillatoria sp. CS-180]|uniref:VCBS domain-containing protein n=1 Tax=Oscillatoria sp. CS-180 TaxID=3021720 RepID=UPI00232D37BF|nr:VCBS domain-containing protein [Oscillatoria sp. CS-180]MDB9525092.1 VCBS domain-containing protein [Oscillatoria sp. CS-180]